MKTVHFTTANAYRKRRPVQRNIPQHEIPDHLFGHPDTVSAGFCVLILLMKQWELRLCFRKSSPKTYAVEYRTQETQSNTFFDTLYPLRLVLESCERITTQLFQVLFCNGRAEGVAGAEQSLGTETLIHTVSQEARDYKMDHEHIIHGKKWPNRFYFRNPTLLIK